MSGLVQGDTGDITLDEKSDTEQQSGRNGVSGQNMVPRSSETRKCVALEGHRVRILQRYRHASQCLQLRREMMIHMRTKDNQRARLVRRDQVQVDSENGSASLRPLNFQSSKYSMGLRPTSQRAKYCTAADDLENPSGPILEHGEDESDEAHSKPVSQHSWPGHREQVTPVMVENPIFVELCELFLRATHKREYPTDAVLRHLVRLGRNFQTSEPQTALERGLHFDHNVSNGDETVHESNNMSSSMDGDAQDPTNGIRDQNDQTRDTTFGDDSDSGNESDNDTDSDDDDDDDDDGDPSTLRTQSRGALSTEDSSRTTAAELGVDIFARPRNGFAPVRRPRQRPRGPILWPTPPTDTQICELFSLPRPYLSTPTYDIETQPAMHLLQIILDIETLMIRLENCGPDDSSGDSSHNDNDNDNGRDRYSPRRRLWQQQQRRRLFDTRHTIRSEILERLGRAVDRAVAAIKQIKAANRTAEQWDVACGFGWG